MPVSGNSPLPMRLMKNTLGSGLRHERFRLLGLKLGILMIPRLPDVKPPCLTSPRKLRFSGLFSFNSAGSWGACGTNQRRSALTWRTVSLAERGVSLRIEDICCCSVRTKSLHLLTWIKPHLTRLIDEAASVQDWLH